MAGFLESGMHWKLINFFLFLGILFYYLRKPISEFWRRRSEGIVTELEEARGRRQEAGKRVLDLEARWNRLEKEKRDLIQSLRDEGELEKEKIIEKADLLAKKLHKDAKRILEQEKDRTRERLRRESVELSVMIAERTIRGGIRSGDQQGLAESFLKGLEPSR